MTDPTRSAPRVRSMFAGIAHRYDLANHVLSGGMDFLWRRRVSRIVREWKPRSILDLATGSGDLALSLQGACAEAFVVGADFCAPMLKVARQKGLRQLVVADGTRLPFATGSFDVVTVAFGLRNMESWSGALAEMARVLKPGGHVLVLDFSLPDPPFLWVYRPYLHHVLPKIAAWLTGDRSAYDYLGDSIEKFPRGDAMCEVIKAAGFSAASHKPLSAGIVSIYIGEMPRPGGEW